MAQVTLHMDVMIERTDAVLAGPVHHETVMMEIKRGRYYGLNPTGSYIWNLLDEPITVRELCVRLTAHFAVSQQQCEDDVMAFLEGLLDRNVIGIAEGLSMS